MASRSWNRVELIGNLTRDPELRYTPNGAAVCTFGLATNRTYVSEGERKEEVDFHRIVSWNKLAELCNQLLKKGHKVFISGRLQTRSWEGQDGQQRQTTEIVVEDMILLSPKSDGVGPHVSEGVTPDVAAEQVFSKKEEPATDKNEEKTEELAKEVASEEKPTTKAKAKPASEEIDGDLPF